MRNKKIYIPKKVKDKIEERFDWASPKRFNEVPGVFVRVGKKAIMVYYKRQRVGNLYINSNHEIVRPSCFNFDKSTYKCILDWHSEASVISELKMIMLRYDK